MKIGTFREWLRETEKEKVETIKEHRYYTEEQLMKDVKLYDSVQRIISGHNIGLESRHNTSLTDRMIILNENIIEPDKIHITSNNIEQLNKKFNKFNIFFTQGAELGAVYKQEKDEIEVFITDNNTHGEIEAMVAHEMVHKEQNKRSSNNYFKQSEVMINAINSLLDKKQKLILKPGGILTHRDEIKKLDNEIKEKYLVFTHLNPFEEMAYACQAVMEYSKEYHKLNDMINLLIIQGFPVTSRFKKYMYMYWLIKDKIKGE